MMSVVLLAIAALTVSHPKKDGWEVGVACVETNAGVSVWRVTAKAERPLPPPRFSVRLSYATTDGHCLWSPAMGTMRPDSGDFRAMPPGLGGGVQSGFDSSFAVWMPLYALYGLDGESRLTIAADETTRAMKNLAGYSELTGHVDFSFRFGCESETPRTNCTVRFRLDETRRSFSDAVRLASDWQRGACGAETPPVPDAAFEPLYSTWYVWHRDVNAKELERELALAADLGIKTVITDDGWQDNRGSAGYGGLGDWKPDPVKFPDMKDHVARMKALGLNYMTWYAVPFVGVHSALHSRFEGKFIGGLGSEVAVLDPRFPEVRDYIASFYAAAVREYGLDGLKLDFLDRFAIEGEDPAVADGFAGRDIPSVSEAAEALLVRIIGEVRAVRPDALVEFRQRYVGPAMARLGNMMRVSDCAGSLRANRCGIAALRLTSGPAAVHSDMLMWAPGSSPEEAARFILHSIFGTVQYSVRLSDQPSEVRETIRHWVKFAREHVRALQRGGFEAHAPELMFPVLEGWTDSERIVGVYAGGQVAKLAFAEPSVYVLNGTASETLTLDLASAAEGEARDALGRRTAAVSVPAGLSSVAVPKSGYLVLTRR